ncbi:MAG: HEAT repeat domain-containing protein [Planctomycetota bacterium]|jgi:HEAT repeat protein|nr:HEAT repeat domain-containing protein [Planctomycetota bacterium]
MRIALLMMLLLAPLTAAEMTTAQARRLEGLIAALTDPRKPINEPAIVGLVALGPDVLPDLNVLAADPEPGVRGRVALVAAGIGGPETMPLLKRMVEDRSDYVREVATLALGQTRTKKAYALLKPRLQDSVPEVRDSAALAMGQLGDLRAIEDLTLWHSAGGALAGLDLKTYPEGDRQRKRIMKSMQASLKALTMRPDAIPVIIELLPGLAPDRQRSLLEASWEIGDPRLSPVLADALYQGESVIRRSAAVSLAANGDGRALKALCRVATDDSVLAVREAAAHSLRSLTGHRAAAGPAWKLWWDNHAGAVAAMTARDEFIAALYDPSHKVTKEDLAGFTPEQLMPLVEGTIGGGAPWWSGVAWRALRTDDATRWTPFLAQQLASEPRERRQVAFVVLLDALGDPAAKPILAARLEALTQQRDEPGMRRQGSLYAALFLAVHGQPAPL